MAKRVLKDWRWFMDSVRISADDLVLKGPRIEGFEADILRITKDGYTVEYEIKIARSDYFADTLKSTWVTDSGRRQMHFDDPVHRVMKHDLLRSGKTVNEFYYVVLKGLVSLQEVPEYAGLIYTHLQNFSVVKPAPQLSDIRRQAMYDSYNRKCNG